MRVCLGGTFDRFHAGHEELLKRALEADEVFVGVTDGALAARNRDVQGWDERAAAVQAFVEPFPAAVTISRLQEPMGPAATGDYDAIVVSPETVPGAHKINAARAAAGLAALQIIVVDHLLGEDKLPISATAISEGRIDRTGKRQRPVRIRAGTQNPVKLAAIRAEMQAFLPGATVEGCDVASGVPEQPKGEETLVGARNRAQAALGDADYAVGVEAGLVAMPGDDAVDVQACVVLDRTGKHTVGWGPGFHYPAWVRERAHSGEMISEILGPVANDPRIGGTTGAIGFLSDGAMDRTELTRIGVRMALVPRVRPQLYR